MLMWFVRGALFAGRFFLSFASFRPLPYIGRIALRSVPFRGSSLSLPPGCGGTAVVGAHPDRVRCLEVADAAALADVGTPADLAALQRRAGG